MLRGGTQHGEPADGNHQRAAHPLQNAHCDKHLHAGGKAAKYRRERKDRQRGGEDLARAEAVGYPAAGRDQHCKGDEVGADTYVQRHRFDAKASRHIRQGRRYHRPVKKLHKKGPGYQQRGGRDAPRLLREGVFTHFWSAISKKIIIIKKNEIVVTLRLINYFLTKLKESRKNWCDIHHKVVDFCDAGHIIRPSTSNTCTTK